MSHKEQLLLNLAATTHVSILPSSSSGRKKAMPTQSSDPSTSPVKLHYAILITLRKLRPYFQAYSISMMTDFPLGYIIHNRNSTGRISKPAVELGTLNIDFKPRNTIKSQALLNFMAEWWENQLPTPIE
jgi:hypothetical protein